jgi:hypothetical protein
VNTRNEWLYDLEQETTAINIGINVCRERHIADRRAVIDHMRASAAKLTQLLANAEQPKENVETYPGKPR